MSSGKKRGKFISHEQLALRGKNKPNISKQVKDSDFNESGLSSVQINLVDLPSKFLPYPKGSMIKYRPYIYEEIMNHTQSKNLTYREEVEYVLSGVYTSFDKYDLTLSDYLFINLLRRISNIGDYDISAKYQCKKCGNLTRSIFKASEIDIDYIQVPKLPVTVTFSSGKTYSFNPITIRSYIELVEEKFKNKHISVPAKCCVSASYEEVYEFFRTLTDPGDIFLAKKVDSLLYHSLKPMALKCSYMHKKYLEKDGYTLKKLKQLRSSKEGEGQLMDLFNKYEIKFVKETDMVDFAFQDLVKKMALVEETPCGHVNSVELDGGGLFIGPFCDFGELTKNRICYGS